MFDSVSSSRWQYVFFPTIQSVLFMLQESEEYPQQPSESSTQLPTFNGLFFKKNETRIFIFFLQRNFVSANICRFHWIASYCPYVLSYIMESTQNSSVNYIGMLPNVQCDA